MVKPRAYVAQELSMMLKQHYPDTVMECVKNMMLPSDNYGRFPGNAHNVTALMRSIREFIVYANFSDPQPGMAGRFSFVASPGIGNNSQNPKDWQVSLINSNPQFPDDLTSATSYITGAAGPVSSDLRMDRYVSALTQPQLGVTTGNWYGAFGVATSAPLSTPAGVIVGNSGLYPIINNQGLISTISLPIGQYYIVLTFAAPNLTTPGSYYLVNGVNGAVVDPIAQQNWWLNNLGTTAGTIQIFAVTIYAANQSIAIESTYPAGASSFGRVEISPGFFPNRTPLIPLNGGLFSKVRTTGMTVLFSNMIAPNYCGGTVVANLIENVSLESNYFINGAQNSLAMWEALSEVNGRPCYKGPVEDGAYAFWVPLDITQTAFVRPDAMATVGYPQLVFSGQYTNAAGLTGIQEVGRVQMITSYEYETVSNVPETDYPEGSLDQLDLLLTVFDKSPVACSNPTHKGLIGKFIKALPKVVSDVNGVIQAGKGVLSTFGM